MYNTFKIKHLALLFAAAGSLVLSAGCGHDHTEPEEVITTVKITFTNQIGGNSQTFTWKDLDGAGGNNPVIDTIKIQNRPYSTTIEFLNESLSPAEDVTAEILEESFDHLVVYTMSDGTEFSIQDRDLNNFPLGLRTQVLTLANGSGKTLNIKLLHNPNKQASNPGGDVDVDVVFPVVVF
jgi:hypothetical protein